MSNAHEAEPGVCPSCGSDRSTWRIHKEGRPRHATLREFIWTCRDCGHLWADELPSIAEAGTAASTSDTEPRDEDENREQRS